MSIKTTYGEAKGQYVQYLQQTDIRYLYDLFEETHPDWMTSFTVWSALAPNGYPVGALSICIQRTRGEPITLTLPMRRCLYWDANALPGSNPYSVK